jgi:hypothetical protein
MEREGKDVQSIGSREAEWIKGRGEIKEKIALGGGGRLKKKELGRGDIQG